MLHPAKYISVILIGILCCCSSQTRSSSHQFQTYIEGGIQVAETTGGPLYDSELFQYDIELIIPAGTTEETALGFPRQFFSDSEGNLYIVDEFRAAVLVYSSDGQYLHTIGRKGYGPGELQSPRVQDVIDHSVSLFDLNTRRLSTFSIDGKLVESVTAPSVPGVQLRSWNLQDYHARSDGNQLLVLRQQDPARARDTNRVITLFLSAACDTLAEIGTDWIKTDYIPVPSGTEPPPPLGRPYPYGPQPTCTVNKQIGVVICDGLNPTLCLYNFNAELTKKIKVTQAPIPIDSDMRQRIRRVISELAQSSEGFFVDYWREYAESLQFPEKLAFSSDIEVEDNGYIWIKIPEYPTGVAEYQHSSWRLISPEGEYLGVTRRPEDDMRNPPGSWRRTFDGRLLIIHEDEATGEWLPTVYRIKPMPRGLKYPN